MTATRPYAPAAIRDLRLRAQALLACAIIAHMEWGEVATRIIEARMQKGLTQSQLAQSLGLERSALAKIESGQRKVNALELAGIARELGRRLEWFVLPRPAGMPQHRGATTPDWVGSDIDVALEQSLADVDFLIELGHLQIPVRPQIFERPGSSADAEALAGRARQICGIAPDSPIDALTTAAWTVGLVPFAEPLGDGADAASTSSDTWGIAVINSSNAVGRRRLALAHELCHYLVNDGYVEDFRVDPATSENQHEARMDRFARAYLLPAEPIGAHWNRLIVRGVRRAAVMLASTFRVDMSTLARRLHNDLGLVDHSIAAEIRQVRTNRSDIVENDLYVPHDLEGTWLHPDYERAVLRAYRADDVTSARALSLLRQNFSEDDLPARATVDEGSLWALTE